MALMEGNKSFLFLWGKVLLALGLFFFRGTSVGAIIERVERYIASF